MRSVCIPNPYRIQFASGTLTALAIPCSMGGQLQGVMAPLGELAKIIVDEKATITTMLAGRPDLYITIDRSTDAE